MGKYSIEVPQFEPHPEGNFEGRIASVDDLGMVTEEFNGEEKTNHKILVRIESYSAKMDDGTPYTVTQRLNISSHPKSKLYRLRQTMLGRKLTKEELRYFDEDELVGRKVGYIVVHSEGREPGIVFANIESIFPLKDQEPVVEAFEPEEKDDEGDDDNDVAAEYIV